MSRHLINEILLQIVMVHSRNLIFNLTMCIIISRFFAADLPEIEYTLLDSFSTVKYLLNSSITSLASHWAPQPPLLHLPAAPGQYRHRSRGCGFCYFSPGQLTTSSHSEESFTAWPPGPLPKQHERFSVK